MKPFLAAIAAMIVIAVGANAYLSTLPMSSADAYSTPNVRLDAPSQ